MTVARHVLKHTKESVRYVWQFLPRPLFLFLQVKVLLSRPHHSFRLAFKNNIYILFGHKYAMCVIHGVS